MYSEENRKTLAGILYSIGRGAAIAFMVLLAIAAVLLSINHVAQANRLAEYAYYSLVASVLSLIAATIVEGEEGQEEKHPDREEKGYGHFPRIRLPVSKIIRIKTPMVLVFSATSFATGLALAYRYGLAVEPGRPTIDVTGTLIPLWVKYLAGVMLFSAGVLITTINRLLGIVVSVLGVATVYAPLAGILASLFLLFHPLPEAILGISALEASVLATMGVLLFGPFSSYTAYGWSIATPLAIVGFIIGFAYAILLLSSIKERRVSDEVIRTGLYPRRSDWIILLIFMLLPVLVIAAAHLAHKGILSLDTLFNLRECHMLAQGEKARVLIGWYRPLYVALVTWPALLLGCPSWFFDILVPFVGFSALSYTSFLVLRALGVERKWLPIGAVLATSYWLPFFLYAGLQTNLLALPIALLMLIFYSWNEPVNAAIPALILALLHPWTLAYFSIVLVIYELLKREISLEAVRQLLIVLLPAWLIYVTISGMAHYLGLHGGVEAVAKSIIKLANPLWSLKYFFWGTMLRADIVPVAVLILIRSRLFSLGLGRESHEHALLVSAILPALLGIVMPQSKLLVRLWVNAPLPLLLTYMLYKHYRASSNKYYYYLALIVSAASLLLLVYFIYMLNPVKT